MMKSSNIKVQTSKLRDHVRANFKAQTQRTMGSRGFTIVELMIATLVFSVVLLLITLGVVSFNEAYYRGVVQSKTQDVARSIIENVSQAIQFSGGQVYSNIATTNGSQGFCIGNQRYSYLPGYELESNPVGADFQASHGLVLDSFNNCSGSSPAQDLKAGSLTSGSSELLGQNMRIAKISITPMANNLYSIDVRVVYGDSDLLCAPSVAASCNTPNSTNGATASDAECKSGAAGTQFCAESELSTTVQERID